MSSLNLLGYTTRVETPFAKITIGDYTFGIHEKTDLANGVDSMGIYKLQKIKYPNFIQSLNVTKINGRVNQYTLNITYPITQNDDPNFFEKVFGSVADTRKIIFSYGDMSAPSYIYRDEEALITSITSNFNAMGSTISYVISAVSTSLLAMSGAWTFEAEFAKPSDIIIRTLYDARYGLLEVFPGMNNKDLVISKSLIQADDKAVNIFKKVNISALDYLNYLVSCMSTDGDTIDKSKVYALTIIDDTSGLFEGPYFKISEISKMRDDLQTYEIDIGYPSQNIVTAFSIDNNETYTLLYKYHNKINDAEYTQRINDNGELEEVYAPVLSSKNEYFETNEAEKTWWTMATKYPLKASITLKGLLRPAILMTHVRLNVYYYGRKHISSGLYIVTAQEDQIDYSGYRTTLKLLRIQSDNS